MATNTSSARTTQQGPRRRGRPPKQAPKQAAEQPTQAARKPEAAKTHGTTVTLPFVTAQFRVPEVHMPRQEDFASAAETVRAQLPSRNHALFYGGLTAGAVLSIIDWPVALAIGVGHALVTRRRGGG
jgi:hypothetical protein